MSDAERPRRLVIEGAAHVLTGPPPYERRDDVSVLIEDGRIREIGAGIVADEGTAVLDGRHGFVLPGFVNGHTHATFGLDGGLAPESSLDEWLPTVFAVSNALDPALSAASAQLTFAEMLAAGYTTCVEHHYAQADPDNAVAVIDAAALTGARVVVAATAYDLGEGGVDLGRGVAELDRVHEHCAATRLVRAGVGLSSPLRRETPDRCRALARWARERGLLVTYHYAENAAWDRLLEESAHEHHHELLGELDLLGDDVVIAHGVSFDVADLDVLASTGTTVSHNPVSNGYLGDGIAPAALMRDVGVNVCLGADSRNCTGRSDPFTAMRTAAGLARAQAGDGAVLPVASLVEMATTAGARACGASGVIAPGEPADLVVVDMSRPHMVPRHDPLWTLVWAAAPEDVRTVVVDGEVVVAEGRPTRVDLDAIARQAELAAASLADRVRGRAPSELPYGGR